MSPLAWNTPPAAPIREDRIAAEPATLDRCREDYTGTTDARRRDETSTAEGQAA
ncbi:hypothetical protein [Streptomyces sp. NPDC006784]|uniref:hypothetical protein n=1 Tax=Streptomyces sp. NPDC006784 TaxID=3364764 RepID=UPI00368977AF